MRAYLPAYELVVTRTLEDALALLRDEPGAWRPLAGGTDLMVLLEAGRLEHRKFFSVRQLAELRGVEESDGHVTIGALTTYTEVRRSRVLAREFPMLVRAGGEVREVRIALGSVAPVVLRCRRTEALLRGRRLDAESAGAALEEIAKEIAPIDDVRSTARYRARVARNLLAEFLAPPF